MKDRLVRLSDVLLVLETQAKNVELLAGTNGHLAEFDRARLLFLWETESFMKQIKSQIIKGDKKCH